GRPTGRMGTSSSSCAWRAPATISVGPRSPPMASTATARVADSRAADRSATDSDALNDAGDASEAEPVIRGPQSTSTACRPPYQPQLGHTTWGSLARWHCGHTLRGGVRRTQLEARRLRVLAFEVFFLGTAIFSRSSRS